MLRVVGLLIFCELLTCNPYRVWAQVADLPRPVSAPAPDQKPHPTALDPDTLSPTTALLRPIVVTPLTSTQGSVSIIDFENLKDKSYSQILDVLKIEAGLDVITNGGPGQAASVFIRGAKSEHTLVFIDGIPVNDASTPGRLFDFSNLMPNNIERIEIYKGPKSVLFGADAIGGVINIISKTGRNSIPETTAYLETGSFGTQFMRTHILGKHKNISYSLGASATHSKGFSAAQTTTPTEDEKDGLRRWSLASKLHWQKSSNTSISGSLQLHRSDLDLDASGGNSGDDPNYTSTSQQVLAGLNGTIHFISQSLIWEWGTYYSQQHRKYDNPADAKNPMIYHEDFNSQNLRLLQKLIWQTTDNTRFFLQIDHRQEWAQSEQNLGGTLSALPTHTQNVFGQSLVWEQTWKKLFVQLGFRHDFINHTQSESLWNENLQISYDLTKTFSLQTNLATGFKPPSLYQLHSNFGDKSLQSESSLAWDVGIEKIWMQKYHLSLTYFQQKFEDLIDFNMSTSKYNNIGQASTLGWEASLWAELTAHWEVQLSYKFLDAYDESHHRRLARRPRHNSSAHLRWKLQRLKIESVARLLDSRPDMDPDSFTAITLPSYFTLQIFAFYQILPRWSIKSHIDNLLDRQYQEVAGYSTAGRSIYVGVEGEF